MFPLLRFSPVKSGNTFQPPGMLCKNSDTDTPINISGYIIKAVLLDPVTKKQVATWSSTGDSPNIDMSQAAEGRFRLNNWNVTVPPGIYSGDIDYEADGIKETFCNIELPVVNAY